MKITEYNLRLKIKELLEELKELEQIYSIEECEEYSQTQVLKGYLTHASYVDKQFESKEGISNIRFLAESLKKAIDSIRFSINQKNKQTEEIEEEREQERILQFLKVGKALILYE